MDPRMSKKTVSENGSRLSFISSEKGLLLIL